MPGHLQSLKEITRLLMQEPLQYTVARNAAYSLKDLFQEATAFEETEDSLTHIETVEGRAVSTVSAAICIIDYMRTRAFLKGIAEAITAKLLENPGKPVTVFYAGTGPFASLLTPLITLFGPAELKMILLDINPVSLDYLRKTIEAFNMQDHVLDIIHADASTYQIKAGQDIDIILSETMMPGLCKEPMVNIFANLAAQYPAALMIPELVRVEAALASNPSNAGHKVLPLQTLMELSAATAVKLNDPENCPAIFNKGIEVKIPVSPDPVYRQFVLLTYIRVFAGNELLLNESALTILFKFKNAWNIEDIPRAMLFKYVRGPFPGFQFIDTADLSKGGEFVFIRR